MQDAVIIGAGPAGLMAAETLADLGRQVLVVEAKPTVGRKLLMAGKSGLNLTKDEIFEKFLPNYHEAATWMAPILADFDNAAVVNWATSLGQEVFTGSSGRVFPKTMKASPLLRAWLARLRSKGVQFQTRSRWTGWQGDSLTIKTPDGPQVIPAKTTILALGGASWSRLGSDGAWAEILHAKGIALTPFQPANMGFTVNWSPHMAKHFGQPVKACALVTGTARHRGEFVISSKGLEGGGIYNISKVLRDGAPLHLDLLPDLTLAQVANRLSKPKGKNSLTNHLRKTLRLDPARLALLQEFARPLPSNPAPLAQTIKNLPVPLTGPRPINEAISTAGGVPISELTDGLMLKTRPNTYCVGEMLDWEAPTGGYLLTACLATGRWAAKAAGRP